MLSQNISSRQISSPYIENVMQSIQKYNINPISLLNETSHKVHKTVDFQITETEKTGQKL